MSPRLRMGLIGFVFLTMAFRPPIGSLHGQETLKDPRAENALQEARQVAKDLAEKIRGLLVQELQKSGPAGAIRVCSEVAQEISLRFGAAPGHSVRRVSLKYRNPKDIPDAYERQRLEQFHLLNQEMKLEEEYAEIVKEQGREYLRYMRPLVILPMCLTCHGPKEKISMEVRSVLSEKYPDDRAIDYHAGDVRGAISVKIALPSVKP